MPRFRRRKNDAPVTLFGILMLGAIAYGYSNPERLRSLAIHLWVSLLLFIVLLAILSYFLWQRKQRKLQALRMIDVDQMDGKAFEDYLAFLLSKRGFTNIQTTRYQGDFGADLLATKDGRKYAIQAKRYRGLVGVEALYQCFGGQKYYGCDACMVITNSKFTPQAKELAKKSATELIDGDTLAGEIVALQQG